MRYHAEIKTDCCAKPAKLHPAKRQAAFVVLAFISCLLFFGGPRQAVAQDKGLIPTLNCVQVRTETGQMTAFFGYVATKNVTVKPGTAANSFSPPPANRGQDKNFFVGVHPVSFPVTFDYFDATPSITWRLDGAEATADLGSRRCDESNPAEQFGFGAVNYLVNERDGSVEVTVVRLNGATRDVSVDYSISGGTATSGTDYLAASGTFNFAAGETSKTFNIPILDEGELEDNETILLRLSNPTGGAKIGTSNLAVVVIEDRNYFTNRSGNRFDSRDIAVHGLKGLITRVKVKLDEFVSRGISTTDALLVSPTGQKMLLMSDAGGNSFAGQLGVFALFAGTLTFDDSATSLLPNDLDITLPGTYRPTNYGGGDTFTAPAPAGPYQSPAPAGKGTLASTFNGTDPNGTWSLYIQNSSFVLVNGWSLSIETVECAEIAVNPEALPGASLGTAYSTKLTASGGTAPYSFILKGGTLPSGMSLRADGTLSGSPAQAGNFPLAILTTDAKGCGGSRLYTLNVGQGIIKLSPSVIPGGAVGLPFSTTVAVTNGTSPFTFNLSGTLPTGLNFSGATIFGTPTQGGAFPITISVKDANGSQASANYTLVINQPPSLSGVSSMTATWNKPLTFTAVAKDLDVPPQALIFSLVNAPVGAFINPITGVFNWTPTGPQLGAFTFTVRVTDNGSPSLSASRVITITVDAGSTTLSVTNIIPGTNAATVTASALLTNTGNDGPLKNRVINFKLGDASVNATTDYTGAANAALMLPEHAGPYTLITTFAGDDFAQSSTALTAFNIALAGNCTHLIFPTNQSFDEHGGPGSIQVNSSQSNCGWSAASYTSWIEVNADPNFAGNRRLNFAVAANHNPILRIGILSIAGITVAILQDAAHPDVYYELKDIRGELETLRATVADKRDQRKLDEAIENLSNTLEPKLWLDQTHLQAGADEMVFKQGKQAVANLIDLLKDKKSSVSDEPLLTLIHRIVRAMRALAVAAMTDIPARDRGKQTCKARPEIPRGDIDIAGGRFLSGIEHFRTGCNLTPVWY
jgi:hypothetical protein